MTLRDVAGAIARVASAAITSRPTRRRIDKDSGNKQVPYPSDLVITRSDSVPSASRTPAQSVQEAARPRRRVVFLNWRDSKHPQAGGAELYCESVARRMADRGAQVTLLAANVRSEPKDEVVQGVTVRRRGGRFTVYLHALWWLLRHASSIDQVVDFQNGIPFFSPLALRSIVPVLCVVFHVHQEQFNVYFRWPLNRFGQWLEGPIARAVYGRRPIVVISPSTRSDVRRKLKLKGPIFVVPCGMDTPLLLNSAIAKRSPEPRIACVGRIVPHKQLNLLIASMPELLNAFPMLRLDIIGTGPAEAELIRQAHELGIDSAVTFGGRAEDEVRDRLLAEAWLTVNPSAGEGWGLSVLEANACGIPAVAFRVPGLQDAIVDRETGWLVDVDASLALTVIDALETLSDPEEAERWELRTRRWAAQFNWDWTTLRIEALLDHESDRLRRFFARDMEQRKHSDLACRVELPASEASLVALQTLCRRTDVWRHDGNRIVALLHGADELGVKLALNRAGVGDEADVRPARPIDWLLGGVPPIHASD